MEKKIGLPHYLLLVCAIVIIVLLYFLFSLKSDQKEFAAKTVPLVGQKAIEGDNTAQLNELLNSIEQLSSRQLEFQSWVEKKFAESEGDNDSFDTGDSSFDEPVPVRMSEEDRKYLYEMAMQNQASDPAGDEWSNETVEEVQTLFVDAPEFASADLVSTQCGAELCRIEVVIKSDTSFEDRMMFENHFLIKLGARLPRTSAFMEKLPDGNTKQIFYMARAGTRLPTESPVSEQAKPSSRNQN